MKLSSSGAAAALVVSEVFPPAIGGSGELLSNIYRRLPALRVSVLTDRPTGTSTESTEDGLTVLRRPMHAPSWGLLRPAGLRYHLGQAALLRRLCAVEPTIIHSARLLPEGLDAWLATRVTGGQYLCWAYGEELAFARTSRELSVLMRQVHRRAATLIAISDNTAAMLRAVGVTPAKIEVVRPGVDCSRFRPDVAGAADLRAELLGNAELLILTVGRLQRRKGHDVVIETLATLDHGRKIRYVIVGDGEERARLEAMAARLKLSDRVRFVGPVSPELLPVYYAAADIFVHPNRVDGKDFEGFGIVFLEAAASGLPVVAGTSGGAPEAVAADETGLLVSGTSVDELRLVLHRLVTSPDLRRRMGEAGRVRAEHHFSWEQAASRVALIHERIARQFAGQDPRSGSRNRG